MSVPSMRIYRAEGGHYAAVFLKADGKPLPMFWLMSADSELEVRTKASEWWRQEHAKLNKLDVAHKSAPEVVAAPPPFKMPWE